MKSWKLFHLLNGKETKRVLKNAAEKYDNKDYTLNGSSRNEILFTDAHRHRRIKYDSEFSIINPIYFSTFPFDESAIAHASPIATSTRKKIDDALVTTKFHRTFGACCCFSLFILIFHRFFFAKSECCYPNAQTSWTRNNFINITQHLAHGVVRSRRNLLLRSNGFV